ncbi:hypothetical protein [Campylobacter devanensis]|uniref:hypothetical protein n=1 Tax=Campylobacter devanensis TaxID=3161138 RepID=UPI00112FA9C5|nr:hypothetical protein [Campylobacter sp. P0136]
MRNLLFLLFISLIFISCSSSKSPYSPSIIDDNFTHNFLKTPILNKFDLTNSNNPTNQTNTTPSNNQSNSSSQPPLLTAPATLGSSPSLGSKSPHLLSSTQWVAQR